jgi:hypothetical protein
MFSTTMSLVILPSDSIHSQHKAGCDFNYSTIPTDVVTRRKYLRNNGGPCLVIGQKTVQLTVRTQDFLCTTNTIVNMTKTI